MTAENPISAQARINTLTAQEQPTAMGGDITLKPAVVTEISPSIQTGVPVMEQLLTGDTARRVIAPREVIHPLTAKMDALRAAAINGKTTLRFSQSSPASDLKMLPDGLRDRVIKGEVDVEVDSGGSHRLIGRNGI